MIVTAVIMIVTIIEVTKEVATVTRVRIIIESSLERHKEEPEKAPSSTRENKGSLINIWVRMPLLVWVITYQKIQTALKFVSMGLPMKNVLSQDVVSAIRSKTMLTKSIPG